jgi:hypothetical protein
VPFERLAEGTSIATLAVIAAVNLSLLRLRRRRVHSAHPRARPDPGTSGGAGDVSGDDRRGASGMTGRGLRSKPMTKTMRPRGSATLMLQPLRS